jgi:hypothetical protein
VLGIGRIWTALLSGSIGSYVLLLLVRSFWSSDCGSEGMGFDPHSGQSKVRLFSLSVLTDKIVLVVQSCKVLNPQFHGLVIPVCRITCEGCGRKTLSSLSSVVNVLYYFGRFVFRCCHLKVRLEEVSLWYSATGLGVGWTWITLFCSSKFSINRRSDQ